MRPGIFCPISFPGLSCLSNTVDNLLEGEGDAYLHPRSLQFLSQTIGLDKAKRETRRSLRRNFNFLGEIRLRVQEYGSWFLRRRFAFLDETRPCVLHDRSIGKITLVYKLYSKSFRRLDPHFRELFALSGNWMHVHPLVCVSRAWITLTIWAERGLLGPHSLRPGY